MRPVKATTLTCVDIAALVVLVSIEVPFMSIPKPGFSDALVVGATFADAFFAPSAYASMVLGPDAL
jgi:hypothetical protein